jgi:hypothetical protein
MHVGSCRGVVDPPAVPVIPLGPPAGSDDESDEKDEMRITGARLDATTFNNITADFMLWLGEGPVNGAERTVKGARLTTESQLKPIRQNLRWLFDIAATVLPSTSVQSMSCLVRQCVIRAVVNYFQKKGVKEGRIYQLALLFKKVIVYLCSRQNRQAATLIQPDAYVTWPAVDNLCGDSGKKRKLAQSDRLVMDPTSQIMSEAELNTVMSGCLNKLMEIEEEAADYIPPRVTEAHKKRYPDYLITVLLASTLAQRQQSFRELTTETVFPPRTETNSSDGYIIRIRAELSKTRMPVLVAIPSILTGHMNWYFTHVLPVNYRGHIFLQRKGDPRQDFSLVTRKVTEELIGRSISAHRFRGSIATIFNARADSSEQMMRTLAVAMNHSSAVQKSHYIYQQRLQNQAQLQQLLMSGAVASTSSSVNPQ